MKLFKFYPNDYCRMYVVGKDIPEILRQREELFIQYLTDDSSWIDVDDPDEDEIEYIEEKRGIFYEGLKKIRELPDGVAIDSHY